MSGSDPEHFEGGLAAVEPPIAAEDKGCTGEFSSYSSECRLDEVLSVVILNVSGHRLSKARSTRLLASERRALDNMYSVRHASDRRTTDSRLSLCRDQLLEAARAQPPRHTTSRPQLTPSKSPLITCSSLVRHISAKSLLIIER